MEFPRRTRNPTPQEPFKLRHTPPTRAVLSVSPQAIPDLATPRTAPGRNRRVRLLGRASRWQFSSRSLRRRQHPEAVASRLQTSVRAGRDRGVCRKGSGTCFGPALHLGPVPRPVCGQSGEAAYRIPVAIPVARLLGPRRIRNRRRASQGRWRDPVGPGTSPAGCWNENVSGTRSAKPDIRAKRFAPLRGPEEDGVERSA